MICASILYNYMIRACKIRNKSVLIDLDPSALDSCDSFNFCLEIPIAFLLACAKLENYGLKQLFFVDPVNQQVAWFSASIAT